MDRLKYVGVALVAGTVGAAVALLLAPDSGENTRRRMRRRLEQERDLLARKGRHVLDEASEYLEEQVQEGRKAVAGAVAGVAEDLGDQVKKGRRKLTRLVR